MTTNYFELTNDQSAKMLSAAGFNVHSNERSGIFITVDSHKNLLAVCRQLYNFLLAKGFEMELSTDTAFSCIRITGMCTPLPNDKVDTKILVSGLVDGMLHE